MWPCGMKASTFAHVLLYRRPAGNVMNTYEVHSRIIYGYMIHDKVGGPSFLSIMYIIT